MGIKNARKKEKSRIKKRARGQTYNIGREKEQAGKQIDKVLTKLDN